MAGGRWPDGQPPLKRLGDAQSIVPWWEGWYPRSYSTRKQKKQDLDGGLGTRVVQAGAVTGIGGILQRDPFPSLKYNLFLAARNMQVSHLSFGNGCTLPVCLDREDMNNLRATLPKQAITAWILVYF